MRRALLSAVLLVGLLGLYLISSHDGPSGHHVVAPSTSISVGAAPASDPVAITGAGRDDPAGGDDSARQMCALLMLAAAAVGLLGQRRMTDRVADTPATRRALLGVLRGPPVPAPRLVLCVERI